MEIGVETLYRARMNAQRIRDFMLDEMRDQMDDIRNRSNILGIQLWARLCRNQNQIIWRCRDVLYLDRYTL